jgi:uncharacterized membrane protein
MMDYISPGTIALIIVIICVALYNALTSNKKPDDKSDE